MDQSPRGPSSPINNTPTLNSALNNVNQSSFAKPRIISSWENPKLSSNKRNVYKTPATLLFGVTAFIIFVISFSITNSTVLRPILFHIVDLEDEFLSLSVGALIATISFFISFLAFYRYFALNETSISQLIFKQQKPITSPLTSPTSPASPTSPYAPTSPQMRGTPYSPRITSPSPSTPYRNGTGPLSPAMPMGTDFKPAPSTFGSPTYTAVPSPMRSPLGYSSPLPASPYYSPNPALTPGRSELRNRASPRYVSNEITDEKGLRHYLLEQEEREKAKHRYDSYASRNYEMFSGPPLPLQVYRTARANVMTSPRSGEDTMNSQQAEELLERLEIEEYIDQWAENMRRWIVNFVVKPMAKRIELFERMNVSLNQPLTNPLPTTTSFSYAQPQSQDQNEIYKERNKYEKYVRLAGATSREYIVNRIKELGHGDFMAAFRWNGGGSWRNKEWTPELPTDTQIVLHLFSCFMDDMLVFDQNTNNYAFSSRYVISAPESPDTRKSSVIIYQKHIYPPHLEVVVYNADRTDDKKAMSFNETWAVFQGRNNMFQALVLFLYYVNTNMSGYLGQISLASKQLKLAEVISKED